jgi:hypothetical protein
MTENPFDPNYRFPPIVKPVDHELRRIEAAAALAMWQCPHCTASLDVIARDGTLPRALGVTHEKGCPDYCE